MRERARSYIVTRVVPPFLAGTGLRTMDQYADLEQELIAEHGYQPLRALERGVVHAYAGVELALSRERLRGVGSYLFALSQLGTQPHAAVQRGLQKGFTALGFDEGVAWGRAHDVIEELRTYYECNPSVSPLDPFYAVGIASGVMANKWTLTGERRRAGVAALPRPEGWLTRLFG